MPQRERVLGDSEASGGCHPTSGTRNLPRVAVVHERFTDRGGSESVVEQLCAIWPQAELFAPIIDETQLPDGLRAATVHDTMLRMLYRGHGRHAHLLPLLPAAMASIDLTGFDLVLTSHHTFAQRVRPPADIPMVSYVHTPARWMWDARVREQELGSRVGHMALSAFATRQRGPDRAAAARPDVVVAASRAVAGRIASWWNRQVPVVHPPVDVDRFRPAGRQAREDFFLYVGRLVPRKRPDVAVAAARAAGVRLVVVGDGRSRPALEQMSGRRVEVLGRVSDEQLRDLYRRCAGLVVPGEEDFGQVAVEAQACGTPVLALGAGGSLDTVVDGVTGRLWRPVSDDTAVGTLAHELRRFDPGAYDAREVRRHAERFAPDRFRRELQTVVEEVIPWMGHTASRLAA